VIVRGKRGTPGRVRVTAAADGLAAGQTTITSR
jgi:hypothetical protein